MPIDGVNTPPIKTTVKAAGTTAAAPASVTAAAPAAAPAGNTAQDSSRMGQANSAQGGSDLTMYHAQEVLKDIRPVIPPAPEPIKQFTAQELTPVVTANTANAGSTPTTNGNNYQDLSVNQNQPSTTINTASASSPTNNTNNTNNTNQTQTTVPTEQPHDIASTNYNKPPMQIAVNPPGTFANTAPTAPMEKVIEVAGTGMGADKTFKMYPSELAAMYAELKKNPVMQLEDMQKALLTDYGIDTEIKDGTLVNKENGNALISDCNGNGALDMGDMDFDSALKSAGIDPASIKEPGDASVNAVSGLAYWANYWADQLAKEFADDDGPKAADVKNTAAPAAPAAPKNQTVINVPGGDKTYKMFPSELAAMYALIKKNDGPMSMADLKKELKDQFNIDTEIHNVDGVDTLTTTDNNHSLIADTNGSGDIDLKDLDFEGSLRKAGVNPDDIEPLHNAKPATDPVAPGTDGSGLPPTTGTSAIDNTDPIAAIDNSGESFEQLIDATGKDGKQFWQFPSELASVYDVLKSNNGAMDLADVKQALSDKFGIDTAIQQIDGKDTLVASGSGHQLLADTDGSGKIDLKDLDFEDTLKRAGLDPTLIAADATTTA